MFTWIVRVKSINCTGFSKKKKTLNFSCEQCEWINSLALVFWIFFLKNIHFSEQCYSGAWLHCSLNSGAWLHCWCFSQTFIKYCFSETCGAIWVLPTESIFILVTKQHLKRLSTNASNFNIKRDYKNLDMSSL